MFNHIRQASLAAAVLAAIPALAAAQAVSYGNAPVSVTSCSTQDDMHFVAPVSLGGQILQSSSDVALNYVNTSNVAATAVTFLVSAGDQTRTIVARGSFAPGVNISRTFSAGIDAPTDANACSVAEVRFADGHVWQAVPREVSDR